MINQTQIPSARVPLTEGENNLISREWFRYFNNINTLAGGGAGLIPVSSGGTGLTTTPSNGQLLIGNGTGYTLNTLSAGTNIAVANGAGNISVSFSGILSPSQGGTGSSTIPPAGAILFGDGTNYTVSANFTYATGTNTFTVGPAGVTTTIETLAPTGSTLAGTLRFLGKNASATNGNGGGFTFTPGNALGTGTGGGVTFNTGNGRSGGNLGFTAANGTVFGGNVTFNSGNGDGPTGVGGNFTLTAGLGTTTASGGNFEMTAGAAASSGAGGSFVMLAGASVSGVGGEVTIASGFGVPNGSIYLGADSGTVIQITQDATPNLQLGFFGATPVAQPTAVPVTAADIHAALVSLGLIT